MTEDKEQNTAISDLSNMAQDMTHIKMKRWYYYTERAKLIFVRGYFPGEGELEKAFSKCEDGSDKDFPHIEIVCKPKELVDFAENIDQSEVVRVGLFIQSLTLHSLKVLHVCSGFRLNLHIPSHLLVRDWQCPLRLFLQWVISHFLPS